MSTQSQKIQAQIRKEERALIESLSLEKYVRVADEDDDRHFQEKDPLTGRYIGERINLNPKFTLAQERSFCGGWHPAIALSTKTNEEVYLPGVQTLEEAKATYGAIHCFLRPWSKDKETGEWLYKISCYGGDDDMVVKSEMKKEKAMRIWNMINHHITRRTLHRLGFAYD
jgi:hypothetical protein